MKLRMRTMRIGVKEFKWATGIGWVPDSKVVYTRHIHVRVWGGGKNGRILLADLESTAPLGPWGTATDTSHPTPRDVRAIIDYALEHGWDPAVIGGRHVLRADAGLEIPGFRFTDLLRDE